MVQYVSRGPIAQWLEQAAHNCLVAGSIPAGPIYNSWSYASLSIVDQAFSIWYHHPIQDTGYYLWRVLAHAASSERRCRDAQKCTPRNIDTQHEGMELHRECPGNVDAEISFRVILFSITRKRILLSTSISQISARMVLPSP